MRDGREPEHAAERETDERDRLTLADRPGLTERQRRQRVACEAQQGQVVGLVNLDHFGSPHSDLSGVVGSRVNDQSSLACDLAAPVDYMRIGDQQVAISDHEAAAPEGEARVLRLGVETYGQQRRLNPGNRIDEWLGGRCSGGAERGDAKHEPAAASDTP